MAPAVPNNSGAMIDLINRRKILLSGVNCFACSGYATPKAIPANIAMKIQWVMVSFFIVLPI